MRKLLCLYMLIISSQIHAKGSLEPLGLDSPATKIDVIVMSLHARLGCKVNYSNTEYGDAVSEPGGILEPQLCLSDLDYLPNIETIRMYFFISDGHHLVNGFEKKNDEEKSKVISNIANRIEYEATRELKLFSLVSQTNPLKLEYVISYNGYRVLRNNKGEMNLTKYEFKKGF